MSVTPPLGLMAALDIGTAKTSCIIARADAQGRLRVLGTATRASKGVRNGAIIDLEAAGLCAGSVVEAAEAMARESIDRVIVNLSCGGIASEQRQAVVLLGTQAIGTAELNRVIGKSREALPGAGRAELHFLPLGYTVDGNRGIPDPRGLFGQRLALDTVAVTCHESAIRTLRTAVARTHLEAQSIVASGFAAGLAVLHADERELGITVIDMGAGSTDIAVFYDNELIFCDSLPVGGGHVTQDIAQGLSTPLAQAERLKTLQGSCLSAASDARDFLDIQPLGDEGEVGTMQAPRALLVRIIQARIEEILELAHDRIAKSGAARFSGGALVLTGGGSQLHGLRELAGQMLDKRVRIGRPSGVAGLADMADNPAFAGAVGLILFAQRRRASLLAAGASHGEKTGMLDRVTGWMRSLR
ncbi:MAG: cell division protein FtsA [Alphaproteobacteria bacterium]|nr:cell division protein FtsA [Alphaproteobacteria bacterium]